MGHKVGVGLNVALNPGPEEFEDLLGTLVGGDDDQEGDETEVVLLEFLVGGFEEGLDDESLLLEDGFLVLHGFDWLGDLGGAEGEEVVVFRGEDGGEVEGGEEFFLVGGDGDDSYLSLLTCCYFSSVFAHLSIQY